jgi:hypothetical protein
MQPSEKSAIIPGMNDFAPILASLLLWLTSSNFVVAADLVLANGRVMEPATGLDAVRIGGAAKPIVK